MWHRDDNGIKEVTIEIETGGTPAELIARLRKLVRDAKKQGVDPDDIDIDAAERLCAFYERGETPEDRRAEWKRCARAVRNAGRGKETSLPRKRIHAENETASVDQRQRRATEEAAMRRLEAEFTADLNSDTLPLCLPKGSGNPFAEAGTGWVSNSGVRKDSHLKLVGDDEPSTG